MVPPLLLMIKQRVLIVFHGSYAELSAEDKGNLVESIKGLAGPARHEDMLDNLEPEARKRVELLREIQSQHDDLEGKFFQERAALEAKYQKMYEPIYSKCYDAVNGVVEVEGVTKEGSDETAEDQIEENGMPDFWLNAMKNHGILAEGERDKEALNYLKDIKWFRISEPKGIKLEFHFDTNPFFKNTVLTITYHMIDEDEPILEKAIGTEIEWYPGKCLTQNVLKKKPKKGSKNAKPIIKTETCESFFSFFSHPEVPHDDKDTAEQLQKQTEQDYDIGSTIRDKNTTGEAAQDEDFELEDEEDNGDEDDDDFASSHPIPIPVIQIQRLLSLPLVLQELFNHRAIVGGGRGHYPMACPGAGSMYMAPSLPDDVLADVLRRLAPHSLAASRCVCKSWHRVVDDHRLLRADLLPLSLGGIFLNFHDIPCAQFLCRPTTGAAVSGELYNALAARFPDYDFVPWPIVLDHCNGLLLLRHCVVNPATRQWTPLPPAPDLPQPLAGMDLITLCFLVFDPIKSPNHFDVLIMPSVPFGLNDECDQFEWPPFTLILPVFSSKTCSWEERTFRQEGEARGMVPGMGYSHPFCNANQCAYWRGALYICCSYFFVLRISLSDNMYRVIGLPTVRLPNDPRYRYEFFIGKSIKGIYCASTLECSSSIQLLVWFLNDLNEWVLKHDRDIFPILSNLNYDKPCDGPWTLQEFDYQRDEENGSVFVDNKEAMVEKEKFEWDSDNDNVLELGRNEEKHVDFLGFHPYKEVVLLSLWDRVLAYHWSSSKIQDLGKLFPKFYFDRGRGFVNKMVTVFSIHSLLVGGAPWKTKLLE